jgi:hypothetical protein
MARAICTESADAITVSNGAAGPLEWLGCVGGTGSKNAGGGNRAVCDVVAGRV